MEENSEERAKRLAQLSEKLAVVRLEHEVKLLETEVLNILNSSLYKKAFVLCVFDASALIDSLKIIKGWIGIGIKSVKIVVPFSGKVLFLCIRIFIDIVISIRGIR